MKNHYVLPVCFAAAAHGALLFGFTKSPRPIALVKEPTFLTRFVIPPKEEEPVVVQPETAEAPPKGVTAPELPRGAEPAPTVVIDNQPTMLAPPITPVNTSDIRSILDGQVGVPDGVGIKPWAKGVISRDLLDNSPKTRFQSSPFYPPEARRNGISGTVTVEFMVDETGRVVDPRVVNSTDRVFEAATLRAVAKWQFEPGRKDGRIVRFRMSAPVVFSLNDN